MLNIVLASREQENFARFAAGLEQKEQVSLTHVDSGAAALATVNGKKIDLVVVGENLTDMTPVEFVMQLVRCQPMINSAMVSGLGHDEFHEATEGLGVLMQLPPNPSVEDSRELLTKIEALSAFFTGQGIGRSQE